MTTVTLTGTEVAEKIERRFPGTIIVADHTSATIDAAHVPEVALFLRDDEDLDGKFLNCLTAVDWITHFEVVYHLSSLSKNQMFVLKARLDHTMPVVPSVSGIWVGAHLQEREAYDLMGVIFTGHPDLKRVFLWDGFPGHPLRKDFLALPGGYKPGLQRFPFEFPEGQRGYPTLDRADSLQAPTVPRLDRPPEPALPVMDPHTAERLVDTADKAEPGPQQVQGAGADVTMAGGTAEDPADSKARSHAGPGAGENEPGEGPAR